MNVKYIKDNPEYIEILESLIEYEKNNKCEDCAYIEDEEYDTCWEYNDVGVTPQKLYRLETNGFLDRVFDTGSTTAYSIIDRKSIEDIVSELSGEFEDGFHKVPHTFPSMGELNEMGIFDDVVGYDDAKWLIKKAMTSDDIVNIVLVGPPGCGKTVFLRCISKLEDATFISGKRTSSSGFTDEMFENKPRFMCIDELDDMADDDQKALSDYTEDGIIVETKGNNKRRKMKTNTKTFASVNSLKKVIDQIDNRFTDLHFDPYTLDEFKEVCRNILPREFGHSAEHAEEIAEAVWDIDGFANVRKAEDVASLSDGDDPQKVVKVMENYSP